MSSAKWRLFCLGLNVLTRDQSRYAPSHRETSLQCPKPQIYFPWRTYYRSEILRLIKLWEVCHPRSFISSKTGEWETRGLLSWNIHGVFIGDKRDPYSVQVTHQHQDISSRQSCTSQVKTPSSSSLTDRGHCILFGSRMRTPKMAVLIRDPIKSDSTCPGATHYANEVLVSPICIMKQFPGPCSTG